MGKGRARARARYRDAQRIDKGVVATGNATLTPRTFGLAEALGLALQGERPPGSGLYDMDPMMRDPRDLVPFGPSNPLAPAPIDPVRPDTRRPEPRVSEYAVSSNLPGTSDRPIPWAVLRQAANGVDIIRRCIEVRKEQLDELDWAIGVDERIVESLYASRTTDSRADIAEELRQQFLPEIERLTAKWKQPWASNGRNYQQWVRTVMEEHLVNDGVAVYPRTSYGGELLDFEVIDSSTIKPLISWRGTQPEPPYPAYQQILYGFPRGEFTAAATLEPDERTGELVEKIQPGMMADQLYYYVHNVRSYTPYGFSAVEQALISTRLYLKRQGWMISEYEDGTTPMMWLVPSAQDQALVSKMTARERREWERSVNAELNGNTAARHRVKITPPGFGPVAMPSVDERYKPDYDLHLIKLVAMPFGITATGLGFSESQGLGNSGLHEGQEKVQDGATVGPDRKMISGIINELMHRWQKAPAELTHSYVDVDAEDTVAQDGVRNAQRARGAITLNEDRRAAGLAPANFPEADMFLVQAGPGGWTPMEGIVARMEQQQANEQALVDGQMAEQAAVDGEEVPAEDVEKALELAEYRRWARKRRVRHTDGVARPFMCKALEPTDFGADGVPLDVAFEGWAWVPDGMTLDDVSAINKADGWRHQLRDRKGRWMKMGTHGPALPGKQVLSGLAEQASAQRTARAASEAAGRVKHSSSTVASMTSPKLSSAARARLGDMAQSGSVYVGTGKLTGEHATLERAGYGKRDGNWLEITEEGRAAAGPLPEKTSPEPIDYSTPAMVRDSRGSYERSKRERKPAESAEPASSLDAARAELRDAEAAHAKTWGASDRDKGLAAARVARAQQALQQAERDAKKPEPAKPKVKRLPDAQHAALTAVAERYAHNVATMNTQSESPMVDPKTIGVRPATADALVKSGHLESATLYGFQKRYRLGEAGHAYLAEHTGDTERARLTEGIADLERQRVELAATRTAYDPSASNLAASLNAATRQVEHQQDATLMRQANELRAQRAKLPVRNAEPVKPALELPAAPDGELSEAQAKSHLDALERALAAHYGQGWEDVELPEAEGKAYVAATRALGDARRRAAAANVPAPRTAEQNTHHVKAAFERAMAEMGAHQSSDDTLELTDLRRHMGGTRAEQDKALTDFALSMQGTLWPEENQKKVTPEMAAGSLRLGGEDKHVIQVDRQHRLAQPATERPSVLQQMDRDAALYDTARAELAKKPGVADGVQRQQQRTTRVGDPVDPDGPVIVRPEGRGAGHAIPARPAPSAQSINDMMLENMAGNLAGPQPTDFGHGSVSGAQVKRGTRLMHRGHEVEALEAPRRAAKDSEGRDGVVFRVRRTDGVGEGTMRVNDGTRVALPAPKPAAAAKPTARRVRQNDGTEGQDMAPVVQDATPRVEHSATPTARSITLPGSITGAQRERLEDTARKLDERHAALFADAEARNAKLVADARRFADENTEGVMGERARDGVARAEAVARAPRGDAAVQATKAARELVAEADKRGFAVMVSHQEDSGGHPFFEVQVLDPARSQGVKMTWHTRKTKGDTYGMFSSSDHKGRPITAKAVREWMDAPQREAAAAALVQERPPLATSPAQKLSTPDIQPGDYRWNEGLKHWEQIGMISDQRDAVGGRTIYGMDRETRLGALPRDTQTWVVRGERPTAPPPPEALRALQRKDGEPVKRGDLYVVERTDNTYYGGNTGSRNPRKTYEVHEVTGVTRDGQPAKLRKLGREYEVKLDQFGKLGREYGRAGILPGDKIDKESLAADLKANTYPNSTTPRDYENMGQLSTVLFGRVKPEAWQQ